MIFTNPYVLLCHFSGILVQIVNFSLFARFSSRIRVETIWRRFEIDLIKVWSGKGGMMRISAPRRGANRLRTGHFPRAWVSRKPWGI